MLTDRVSWVTKETINFAVNYSIQSITMRIAWLVLLLFWGNNQGVASRFVNLFSPDQTVQFNLQLTADGSIKYSLYVDKKTILKEGVLGFSLKNQAPLDKHFEWIAIDTLTVNESWNPAWGTSRTMWNHYTKMVVKFKQTSTGRSLTIECRLYNGGFGLRYLFPGENNWRDFIISEELTSFPLTGDHKTFWKQGHYDTQQWSYHNTLLSKVSSGLSSLQKTVHLPITFETKEGLYVCILEAGRLNYPAMLLEPDTKPNTLKTHLVPDRLGNKAYMQAPGQTPWRVVLIGRSAAELLGNHMAVNLNEPSTLESTDWIAPGKYFLLRLQNTNPAVITDANHPTSQIRKAIDFAAQHRLPYVLIEGWNVRHPGSDTSWNEEKARFDQTIQGLDLPAISEYARQQNVRIMLQQQTSGAVTDYERQLSNTFHFLKTFAIGGMEMAYQGPLIPRSEHLLGQWMSNHLAYILRTAAANQQMIWTQDLQWSSGLEKTYPNWMGSRYQSLQDSNGSDGKGTVDQSCILPFTEGLQGPLNVHQGIFFNQALNDTLGSTFQSPYTRSKQLAMYVCLYSPMPMAAHQMVTDPLSLKAFQFIEELPVAWDTTVILDAVPGTLISLARKDRHSADWFVGVMNADQPKEYVLRFQYLDPALKYEATIYKDAPASSPHGKLTDYLYDQRTIDAKSTLKIQLASGGGCAIRLKAKQK